MPLPHERETRVARRPARRPLTYGKEAMRTRLLVTAICGLALLFSTTVPAFATGDTDVTTAAVDVAVARPIGLAFTIVGTALFVVSLPFTVPSHSVGKAAHTLVVAPAKDTFTRPLGDLDDFMNY